MASDTQGLLGGAYSGRTVGLNPRYNKDIASIIICLALMLLAPVARAEGAVAADNARARPQLTPFQWSTPASTEADSTNGDGQKGIPVLRKELQPQAGPEIEWVCEELAPPRMFCYRKSKPDAPQSSSTAAVSVQLEAAVPDAAPSAAP